MIKVGFVGFDKLGFRYGGKAIDYQKTVANAAARDRIAGGKKRHSRLIRASNSTERVLVSTIEGLEDRNLQTKAIPKLRSVPWTDLGRNGLVLGLSTAAGLNLEGPGSVLEALGVLAAIVAVHESGHFLAARLQNVHVTKFSIGFGPKLLKFQGKNVEYSLRLFPLGGYVAFPDDDPESEFAEDDPNLLKNRPILDRVLVISAGVVANMVFAYSLLFTQVLTVGFLQQEVFPGVLVPGVASSSIAAEAGIKAGDLIMAVDEDSISAGESSVYKLVERIKGNPGKKITFSIQRGQELVQVDLTPEKNENGTGRIGVQLSPNAKVIKAKAKNVADAVVRSSKEMYKLTGIVLNGLKEVFLNFSETAEKLSGPVGIVAVGAEVARSDAGGLFQFAAIVNLNLAVVNVLPLPALDGGYLLLIFVEALRGGKKLPQQIEQGIMSSGILLLLALGAVLIVRDTLNLSFVQNMLL